MKATAVVGDLASAVLHGYTLLRSPASRFEQRRIDLVHLTKARLSLQMALQGALLAYSQATMMRLLLNSVVWRNSDTLHAHQILSNRCQMI